MTNYEFAELAIWIANKYKTLYVMGCFGAPLNEKNKKRYTQNHRYNMQADRTKMIMDATEDTFGFDCVNLIKGIQWGWCGDKDKTYGGAQYNTNNCHDYSADGMIQVCDGISTDFSHIEVGEAVWLRGHIGLYIGDGLVVESSPKWKNCVQITACGNIGTKDGYNTRVWVKHGKLPFITYVQAKEEKPVVKPVEKPIEKPVVTAPKEEEETVTITMRVLKKYVKAPEQVKTLQRLLNAMDNAKLEVDGSFGNLTDAAVRNFQKKRKLTVDGSVGEQTWNALLR